MVVDRPDGLVVVDVEIEFNFKVYKKLEIDLKHINSGKNFSRETNFSVDEIVDLVINFLDGNVLEPHSHRKFEDETCEYFFLKDIYKGKKYKLVICTCTDLQENLGIMTFYRIRS
jgi:hypothetical protein